MEDLAEKIKKGEDNFDVVIATPATMKIVSPLGKILGPKGTMPNPKTGTVTKDIGKAVKNAKSWDKLDIEPIKAELFMEE